MKLSANAKTFVAAKVTDAFAKELKENQDEADAVKKAYVERWEKVKVKIQKIEDDAKKAVEKVVKDSGLKLRKGCSLPCVAINNVDRDHFVEVCSYVYSPEYKPDNGYFRVKAKIEEIEKQIKDSINRAMFEIEVHGSKQKLEEIINMVIADAKKNGKVTAKKENK